MRSGRRSHSPQRSASRMKQERDDGCCRGNEERHPREQEHQWDRSSDWDRHKDHSDRKKNPSDRPRAHSHERDTQNLRKQQPEREFYNERRQEYWQGTKGSSNQNPELRQFKSKPREKAVKNKQKPSLELSRALLEDTNTFQGVVIKYSEPREAHILKTRWRCAPSRTSSCP